MKRWHTAVRVLAFFLVLAAAYSVVQYAFCIRDYSISSRETELAHERANSLDAVYIGSSHTVAFYEPPLAWEDYGIAVFDYATPSMSYLAIRPRLIQARKTQPNALYLINLNCFAQENSHNEAIHRNADFLPWSLEKLDMVNALADSAGLSFWERLEYYFPIIRFHSSWSELTDWDFVHPILNLKGAYTFSAFLTYVANVSGKVIRTEAAPALDEGKADAMAELLDYCDREGVRVLFLVVPQALSAESCANVLAAEEAVVQRGYQCLDLLTSNEKIGIQESVDYQDKGHLNIHGAVKFTDYLARYLVERYGFTDKRGQAGYESWDESVALYAPYVNRYTLPLERDASLRDYALAAPALQTPKRTKEGLRLTWTPTEGAEGYQVYRKSDAEGDRDWRLIEHLDADADTCLDGAVQAGVTYYYTVVPVRFQSGETVYGCFDYTGQKLAVPKS